MNLKHFFYKGYYQGIDLRKFPRKSEQDKVKAHNTSKFESLNAQLCVPLGDLDQPDHEVWTKQFAAGSGLPLTYVRSWFKTGYPGLLLGSGYTHETGNEGEFKLGFFFDHTTGLPVIPGHSIKGVLRSAFPGFKLGNGEDLFTFKVENPVPPHQMPKARWIENWLKEKADIQKPEGWPDGGLAHLLEWAIFEGLDVAAAEAAGWKVQRLPMSKRAVFLDAQVIELAPDGVLLGGDVLTPHKDNPLKDPIPLPFVKVMPEVKFEFKFLLPKLSLLGKEIPAEKLVELFETLIGALGVGAKTNVGYGRLKKTKIEVDPTTLLKDIDTSKFYRPLAPGPIYAQVIGPSNNPKKGKIQLMVKNEVLYLNEKYVKDQDLAPGTMIEIKLRRGGSPNTPWESDFIKIVDPNAPL